MDAWCLIPHVTYKMVCKINKVAIMLAYFKMLDSILFLYQVYSNS